MAVQMCSLCLKPQKHTRVLPYCPLRMKQRALKPDIICIVSTVYHGIRAL